MKIKYIYEILAYYNLDYNIAVTNKDELTLYNKSEIYELDEFLSENFNSYEFIENYDYIIIKFNDLKENSDSIKSYTDLLTYIKENEIYTKLLESDSDYKIALNKVGMNALSDASCKFYCNHKGYFSFNLIESGSDLYEFLSEILSDKDAYDKFNYVIYPELDEFIENYYNNCYEFHNFKFNITDESNILIDYNKKEIRNIDESDSDELIKYAVRYNFIDENSSKIYESKIDEFIELLSNFYDLLEYEILENSDYNLKYLNNKCLIQFKTFKKYFNSDEYLFINYNKSENESISKKDLLKASDELISDLLYAYKYYDSDSYEINEFKKALSLLI